MAGTYLTPCTASPTTGLLMKAETCILVGTERLYDALEVTSWTYATYEASIGLQAGKSFNLGIIAELTWSHKPTFEALEAYNMSDDPLYEVTGEETMVSVTIREFNVGMLELAMGTGARYDLGSEAIITFGGGCQMLRRPYSFEFVNESCFAPTSQDVDLGITGGSITLYDAFVQSGIEWAMAAKEGNTVPLEIQALPVTERARSNRLGVLYLY